MSREEPRSIQIRREVLVRLNRLAGRIELTAQSQSPSKYENDSSKVFNWTLSAGRGGTAELKTGKVIRANPARSAVILPSTRMIYAALSFPSVTISEKSAIDENSFSRVRSNASRLARTRSSSTMTITLSKK